MLHTLKRALEAEGDGRFGPFGGADAENTSGGGTQTDLLLILGAPPDGSLGRITVLSGREAARRPLPGAEGLITYGLSQKDTLTVSSAVDRDLALALQREIVDLRGRRVDRQELLLRRPPYLGLEQTMACVGGLLALGIPPEDIPAILPAQRPSRLKMFAP
ncbi:MAG: hypothetical protein LBT60_02225 [Oscillospiraceae bacterium]|nr:hypothetical protein [Oscillospiraceae bacterium]